MFEDQNVPKRTTRRTLAFTRPCCYAAGNKAKGHTKELRQLSIAANRSKKNRRTKSKVLILQKVLYLFFHRPVLECCVLPATRGVIDRDVCHFPIFSDQVGRLTVEVHHRKALFTLEHIESPTFLGLKHSKKICAFPLGR